MGATSDINEPFDPLALERACEALPLFPLPNVVFFPYSLLPLHVFEPRYRALVRYCLDRHGFLAVPRLRPGWEEQYDGRPAVFDTIGVGRIVRYQELSDGRFYIVLQGISRAEIIQETDDTRAFRLATTRLIAPDDRAKPSGAAIVQPLRVMVGQLLAQGIGVESGLTQLLEEEPAPGEMVDRLAHASLRDPDDRQEYLESLSLQRRADIVATALAALVIGPTTPEA